MKKLSVIIPAFNEKGTILEILKKVKEVNLPLEKEIIIIDDCSTDGTREALEDLACRPNGKDLMIYFNERNEGKGASVKKGFGKASGDLVIIQDADLEYDPRDYKNVLEPILRGSADVVYGSRFLGSEPKRVFLFYHLLGNRFLTFLSNVFTGLALTDMETCYKAFTKEVVDSLKSRLESKRFGIEPELTARMAKGKWRVYEVGISYYGRDYEEGKKINWKDGVAAIWHIIKYNLFAK